jgi:DNA-binding CsgD family transcriptional regulator
VPTATVAYSYEFQGLNDHSRPGHSLLAQSAPAQTAPAQRRPRLRIAGYRRQRPLWGIEALTPAELRVARHAADGMSNPQIAALLFVTRGTVESQLHAVYRKLGIPGRQQLRAELAVLVSESA